MNLTGKYDNRIPGFQFISFKINRQMLIPGNDNSDKEVVVTMKTMHMLPYCAIIIVAKHKEAV